MDEVSGFFESYLNEEYEPVKDLDDGLAYLADGAPASKPQENQDDEDDYGEEDEGPEEDTAELRRRVIEDLECELA